MVDVYGNRARFHFFRPGAQAVHLAGDFNGWRTDQLPMSPAGDGWWMASLRPRPGTYRFGYVADGRWSYDYAAFGLEPGPNGLVSVLEVPPSGTRPSR